MLLCACALLLRALWRLEARDPGFVTTRVLMATAPLRMPKDETVARRVALYDRILTEVRRQPGVESAAFISFVPMLSEMRAGIFNVTLEGHPQDPTTMHVASIRFVTPEFFRTMGIAMRRGRASTPPTRRPRPMSWSSANRSPSRTGRTSRRSAGGSIWLFTIAPWLGLSPTYPSAASSGRASRRRIRRRRRCAIASSRGLHRGSRREVRDGPDGARSHNSARGARGRSGAARDRHRATGRGRGRRQRAARSAGTSARRLRDGRLPARGARPARSVSFSVSARTREIGLRMALGASRGSVLALVLRRSALLTGIGLAAGAGLAGFAAASLRPVLAGLNPFDGAAFAVAGVLPH